MHGNPGSAREDSWLGIPREAQDEAMDVGIGALELARWRSL